MWNVDSTPLFRAIKPKVVLYNAENASNKRIERLEDIWAALPSSLGFKKVGSIKLRTSCTRFLSSNAPIASICEFCWDF
jgi:hypothetical protein